MRASAWRADMHLLPTTSELDPGAGLFGAEQCEKVIIPRVSQMFVGLSHADVGCRSGRQ